MMREKDNRESGLPEDYSYEDDMKQYQAMLEEMAAHRSATEAMIQQLSQQNTAMMQALTQIGAAMTAPKRVIKDANGSPVGVETVLQ